MKIFQDITTLKKELSQEIMENSRDMKKFYTLNTEERSNVLGRIAIHNSLKELEKGNEEL